MRRGYGEFALDDIVQYNWKVEMRGGTGVDEVTPPEYPFQEIFQEIRVVLSLAKILS